MRALSQKETNMATKDDIINHLRALSEYKDRPLCDEDGIPYYANGGNCDDTYLQGAEDGAIDLAKALIDSLDNGADLPQLPDDDDE
jgi:hydroxylamine reductase (hybrid-cluster protein)